MLRVLKKDPVVLSVDREHAVSVLDRISPLFAALRVDRHSSLHIQMRRPQMRQIREFCQIPGILRSDLRVRERSCIKRREIVGHAVLRDLNLQKAPYILRALPENIRVSFSVLVQISVKICSAAVREHTPSECIAHHAVRNDSLVILRHRLQEALGKPHQGQFLVHCP